MSNYYKDMPDDFKQAVDVIKKYCQNEACDYKCTQCPFPLSEIRKRDDKRQQLRHHTRIDHIRHMSIEEMARFLGDEPPCFKTYREYVEWLNEEIKDKSN